MVQILSTLIPADGGEARVAGHDVAREPDAVRAVIGVTGQFSAVDGLFTGEENLQLMADLRHLGKRDGPPARRRAARAVRPGRRGRASRSSTYSGGHAAAARPGHDARRRPADHLPRRADGRPRPAQPPRACGRSIRELVADGVTIFLTTQYLEEADRLADRIARARPGRLVAEGTPAELKRLRARRPHPAPVRRRRPSWTGRPGRFPGAARDDEALTLQVPSDGGVHSLRALLDQLDADVDRRRRPLGPDPGPRRRLPVAHRRRPTTRRWPPDDRLSPRRRPTRRRCCGGTCAACAATRR